MRCRGTPRNSFVGGRQYDNSTDTVSVIDVASGTVVNSIPIGNVGLNPQGVAFSPGGTFAYVSNYNDNTVSVIDVASNTVVRTISVGAGPSSIAFAPNGNFLYVTDSGDSAISVINVASNTVVHTISVGSSPVSVAFSPAHASTIAYATNYNDGTISVINSASNTVTGTITIPSPISYASLSYRASSTTPNTFNVIATDMGTTNPFAFGSLSNTLTIYPPPPLRAGQIPTDPIVFAGYPIFLTSNATGGLPPYNYTWYTSSLGDPACNSIYAIPNATESAYTASPLLPKTATHTKLQMQLAIQPAQT